MTKGHGRDRAPVRHPHEAWEEFWRRFMAWLKGQKPVNPCLLAGTVVHTPSGPKNVEDLAEGDLIETVDGSSWQKIVHISRRSYTAEEVAQDEALKPYRVEFMGVAYVSKWHRVAVTGKLISAHHLSISLPGTCRQDSAWSGAVTWINIFTERHSLIMANDVVVETGWLGGPMAPRLLGEDWPKVMHLAEDHRENPALPFADAV